LEHRISATVRFSNGDPTTGTGKAGTESEGWSGSALQLWMF